MKAQTLSDWSEAQRAKLDSYLLAAFATGFSEYATGPGERETISIGFTVELAKERADTVRDELLSGFASGSGRLTSSHLDALKDGGTAFVTADVTLEQLRQLRDAGYVKEIQLCADLLPLRAVRRTSLALNPNKSAPAAIPRSNADRILAVIDHGCPFAHQGLLDSGRTRVAAIWDQDKIPDFPATAGSVPEGFGYGRQIGAPVLNNFILRAATPTGRIDEDWCYRIAEYPAVDARYTHGSLVLGWLASKWPSRSVDKRGSNPRDEPLGADLIFVQLPRAIPVAPSRGSIERCTLDGIRYVLDCAKDNSQVAVVVDYGTEMGPHNGRSWFERALDAIVGEAKKLRGITLDVVLPAGNSHDRKRHAVIFNAGRSDGPTARLGWWVPRANDAPLTMEMWVSEKTANFALKLTPPNSSDQPILVDMGSDSIQTWPSGAAPRCVVVCRESGKERQVLVQVAPTNSADGRPRAPAGVWLVELVAKNGAAAGPVHAYTCWGGRNPAMPQRIWAGMFHAPRNQPDLVEVTGSGSVLGSGCGKEALMVGGYENWGGFARATYSSGGEARAGHRTGPRRGCDFLAVTEESPALAGLLSQGTRSGAWVRARGTSFGAPQVARQLMKGGRGALKGTPPPAQTPRPSPGEKKRAEYSEPRLALTTEPATPSAARSAAPAAPGSRRSPGP